MSGENTYRRVGQTELKIQAQSVSMIYEYELTQPLSFQAKDFLGIYHPSNSNSQIEYISRLGVLSYYSRIADDVVDPLMETFITDGTERDNDQLPLVSAEIGKPNRHSQEHTLIMHCSQATLLRQ